MPNILLLEFKLRTTLNHQLSKHQKNSRQDPLYIDAQQDYNILTKRNTRLRYVVT